MNGTEKSILVLIANRDQSIAAAKAYNLRPYFRTLRTDLSWMSFRNCIGLAVHSLAWFKKNIISPEKILTASFKAVQTKFKKMMS